MRKFYNSILLKDSRSRQQEPPPPTQQEPPEGQQAPAEEPTQEEPPLAAQPCLSRSRRVILRLRLCGRRHILHRQCSHSSNHSSHNSNSILAFQISSLLRFAWKILVEFKAGIGAMINSVANHVWEFVYTGSSERAPPRYPTDDRPAIIFLSRARKRREGTFTASLLS